MDKNDDITDVYQNIFSKENRVKRINEFEKRLKRLERIIFWLSIPIVGYLLGLTLNYFINCIK